MQIKQWEDKHLAHFSYAILSDRAREVVVIDPARNPRQYLDYAAENDARIVAVMETHPHADFISSHLELHRVTGAAIYASKLTNAKYPVNHFDEGQCIQSGNVTFWAINTPGHSPDSISILLEHDGKQTAVFTGDTLFIGDCGRPDLRNDGAKANVAADTLARQMYHSLRNKLMVLPDGVIVYPAHGAGTLCGKALSKASSSTVGEEKKTNWSMQGQSADEFVRNLLDDQPFVPAYFSYDVQLNKKGAASFGESVARVKRGAKINGRVPVSFNPDNLWIVDVRDQQAYKRGIYRVALT